ncbi:hypothetical protein V6N13_058977 [Hibiscus sabdariffa]
MEVEGSSADRGGDESADHVLRECMYAKAIWRDIIQPGRLNEFLTLSYIACFEVNLQDSYDFARGVENWKERFVVFSWMLWKHRCS